MRSRVELFEAIRRDRDRENLSKRALAGRHRVHRRTVNQALASAIPPPRKRPRGRPAPKLGPFRELIDGWLEADKDAPPKQRHTAKRIHQRLTSEKGLQVSERQVRRHVAGRRRALGLGPEGHVCRRSRNPPHIRSPKFPRQSDRPRVAGARRAEAKRGR